MEIPIMTSISTLDCYIPVIGTDDIEIDMIKTSQLFFIKHLTYALLFLKLFSHEIPTKF